MGERVFIPHEHCPLLDGACFREGKCERVYGSTCSRYYAETVDLTIGTTKAEKDAFEKCVSRSGLEAGDLLRRMVSLWQTAKSETDCG